VTARSSNAVIAARYIPLDYQQHCVFIITACVEIPGIYEYREGMTVADLIAAAGGLASDQRNTNNPTLPLCISVYRMKRPIYPVGDLFHCVFQLNLDETNAAICEANFELQPGDDVTIGRYPCVP
jgi:protein involved in polysaccharide export with SLBB domain